MVKQNHNACEHFVRHKSILPSAVPAANTPASTPTLPLPPPSQLLAQFMAVTDASLGPLSTDNNDVDVLL